MTELKKIKIRNFKPENGSDSQDIVLSYQFFGKPLGEAPVVLVNHALTGNSNVIGENGWWNELIGENEGINPQNFTILAFNIPGNGFGGEENIIKNYKDFTIRDIAKIFWEGVNSLKINNLFAAVGGSLGGNIAWEMVAQENDRIKQMILVAADWKSTDWVIGNVLVQDNILNNSQKPIPDARAHGMLLYRTPESMQIRFKRELQAETANLFQIESWLNYHGQKLQSRFSLEAYKMMNYLLRTADITQGRKPFPQVAADIKSDIHLIAIDSDLFFPAKEIFRDYEELKKIKKNVFYHEIKSIHGHDAFLIEYQQLNNIVKPLFE